LNRSRVNYIEESIEHPKHSTFFTCGLAKEDDDDVWFLANGYSNHMTRNCDLFGKINESVRSQVKFGNDKEVEVMGKGFLSTKTKQG